VSEDELAARFVADIEDGITEREDSGEIRLRSAVRAGANQDAGSHGGPPARDRRAYVAAAAAHHRTGAPIHTHCEAGTGALEQLRVLRDAGVSPDRISLSPVDKVVDRGYHEAILATGAFVAYDQAFRWGDARNGTIELIEWAAEDGALAQVMLGMDAARQGYLASYGGRPGLTYLLDTFSRALEERGLDARARRRLFVDNPARAFVFAPTEEG
jgi:phosphotriesterase-related protein